MLIAQSNDLVMDAISALRMVATLSRRDAANYLLSVQSVRKKNFFIKGWEQGLRRTAIKASRRFLSADDIHDGHDLGGQTGL